MSNAFHHLFRLCQIVALTICAIFCQTMSYAQGPTIQILGSDTVRLNVYTPFLDEGAFAYDSVDGDLSSSIVYSSNIDTSKLGQYLATYSVTNSRGKSAFASRIVIVGDWIPPVLKGMNGPIIKLLPMTPIAINEFVMVKDNYSSPSFLLSTLDTLYNDVNFDSIGIYSIILQVKDSEGNLSDSSKLWVVVDDPYPDCFPTYEPALTELVVYPNPCSGSFAVLPSSKTGYSLRVFSLKGELVYIEFVPGKGVHKVALNVVPGIYLVETRSDKGVEVKKLVVR